jgi:hypothetical protein
VVDSEGIETIKHQLDQLRADTRTLHATRTQQLESLLKSMTHVTREITALKNTTTTGHLRLGDMEALTGKLAGLGLDGRWLVIEQKILTSLDFDHRSERQRAIPDAHTDTFKWVSRTKSSGLDVPARFSDWLENGNRQFWISGKPGSGKSTFMKHIAHNEYVRAALPKWAGSKRLMVASYYFWSAGHPLQKSLYGLMRSILHDILDQVRDSIRNVCSHRWDDRGKFVVKKWSLSELQNCLDKLSTLVNLHNRFCFFIDGLDEYDGDHVETCQTLLNLCHSADIKICTSSRPWNIFENQLGKDELRKLYINELTQEDIRNYINDRLHQHPQWAESCSEDVRAESLIDEVAKRAQGVFLWVFVVTLLDTSTT